MTPERFWDLIGTLEGVADDSSCAGLDEPLRETGEGTTFTDLVDEHVNMLLATSMRIIGGWTRPSPCSASDSW